MGPVNEHQVDTSSEAFGLPGNPDAQSRCQQSRKLFGPGGRDAVSSLDPRDGQRASFHFWLRSGRRVWHGGRPGRPDRPRPPAACIRARFSSGDGIVWVMTGLFGSAPESWSFHPPRGRTRWGRVYGPSRCADTNPRYVWPWLRNAGLAERSSSDAAKTDGVFAQPSPDGGVTEGGRQTAGADMGAEFRYAPARKGHTAAIGKFAGDGFNLHDQCCGEKPGGGRGDGSLPDLPSVFRRTVSASG